MKIYVPFVVLPLMVYTTDTDYFLCVVQAETKETRKHNCVINYNTSHLQHLIGYKISIMADYESTC